jgi:hypothetical protein
LSRPENLICRDDYRFGFADARRAKKQKTSARPAGLCQAEFAALNRRDNARQDLGLAADFVWQQRVQFLEFGQLIRVGSFIHPPLLAGSHFKLCARHAIEVLLLSKCSCDAANKSLRQQMNNKTMRMKIIKHILPKIRSRLRSLLMAAAVLALNTLPALAQSTTFSSTDLRTGISNSLAVIMMFGFVLGIAAVIYGGFAIRRGDVDQGKMSIIGGAIIAAAPAVVYAFYKIFGLDSNSAVGVGTF